jgi:hypothetical protein
VSEGDDSDEGAWGNMEDEEEEEVVETKQGKAANGTNKARAVKKAQKVVEIEKMDEGKEEEEKKEEGEGDKKEQTDNGVPKAPMDHVRVCLPLLLSLSLLFYFYPLIILPSPPHFTDFVRSRFRETPKIEGNEG